jgi:hypothetical protein
MDDWPSSPGVQDLRNVAADLHHGLRQQRLIGEADAIEHALGKARDAGVPLEERQMMATMQFWRLFDETARLRTRRRRRRMRSGQTGALVEVEARIGLPVSAGSQQQPLGSTKARRNARRPDRTR